MGFVSLKRKRGGLLFFSGLHLVPLLLRGERGAPEARALRFLLGSRRVLQWRRSSRCAPGRARWAPGLHLMRPGSFAPGAPSRPHTAARACRALGRAGLRTAECMGALRSRRSPPPLHALSMPGGGRGRPGTLPEALPGSESWREGREVARSLSSRTRCRAFVPSPLFPAGGSSRRPSPRRPAGLDHRLCPAPFAFPLSQARFPSSRRLTPGEKFFP